jgi:hypothetical protein
VTQFRAASLLLVALIAVSTAAFLRTQQLKLTKSPVARPKIKQSFSPACSANSPQCHKRAILVFRLRKPERISLSIVRAGDGALVRGLLGNEQRPAGVVRVVWNGRDDKGAVVPDGRYELAVHLGAADRTITIPDPIRVDTRPPAVDITSVDRGRKRTRLHFLASEPARTYRLITARGRTISDGRTWNRTSWTFAKKAYPRGVYTVTIYAEDSAGNRTTSPPSVRIRVP